VQSEIEKYHLILLSIYIERSHNFYSRDKNYGMKTYIAFQMSFGCFVL